MFSNPHKTYAIYIPNQRIFLPQFIVWPHYLQTHHRLAENKTQSFRLHVYRKIFWQLPPKKWVPLERELRELSQNARVGRRGWTIGEWWLKNHVAGVSFNGFLRLARPSTMAEILGRASPIASPFQCVARVSHWWRKWRRNGKLQWVAIEASRERREREGKICNRILGEGVLCGLMATRN